MYGLERTLNPITTDEDACIILQVKGAATYEAARQAAGSIGQSVFAGVQTAEFAILLQLDSAYASYADRRLRGVEGPGLDIADHRELALNFLRLAVEQGAFFVDSWEREDVAAYLREAVAVSMGKDPAEMHRLDTVIFGRLEARLAAQQPLS